MLKLLRWAFALAMCCAALTSWGDDTYEHNLRIMRENERIMNESSQRVQAAEAQRQEALSQEAPVDPEVQRQEALRQEKIRQRKAYLNSLDQWGAIAVDIKEGRNYKISYDHNEANVNEPAYFMPPEEYAKALAVDYCRSGGGVDCQVIATFKNTCAALIATPWSGKDGAVVGLGPSLSQATEAGMALCAKITPPDVGRCVPWGKPVCTRRIDP